MDDDPKHNPGEPEFGDHVDEAPHNPGEPQFDDPEETELSDEDDEDEGGAAT